MSIYKKHEIREKFFSGIDSFLGDNTNKGRVRLEEGKLKWVDEDKNPLHLRNLGNPYFYVFSRTLENIEKTENWAQSSTAAAQKYDFATLRALEETLETHNVIPKQILTTVIENKKKNSNSFKGVKTLTTISDDLQKADKTISGKIEELEKGYKKQETWVKIAAAFISFFNDFGAEIAPCAQVESAIMLNNKIEELRSLHKGIKKTESFVQSRITVFEKKLQRALEPFTSFEKTNKGLIREKINSPETVQIRETFESNLAELQIPENEEITLRNSDIEALLQQGFTVDDILKMSNDEILTFLHRAN